MDEAPALPEPIDLRTTTPQIGDRIAWERWVVHRRQFSHAGRAVRFDHHARPGGAYRVMILGAVELRPAYGTLIGELGGHWRQLVTGIIIGRWPEEATT